MLRVAVPTPEHVDVHCAALADSRIWKQAVILHTSESAACRSSPSHVDGSKYHFVKATLLLWTRGSGFYVIQCND